MNYELCAWSIVVFMLLFWAYVKISSWITWHTKIYGEYHVIECMLNLLFPRRHIYGENPIFSFNTTDKTEFVSNKFIGE